MERNRKLLWGKAAVIAAAIPVVLWAHEYGPDVGYSGVPGENGTCAVCHTGTGVNAGGGSVSVSFPNGSTYTPGLPQQLTVTIADSAQRAWGFQLTARTATSSSTQAGTFASVDANTQVGCGDTMVDLNEQFFSFGMPQNCPASQPLSYMEQSLIGYNATKGQVSGSGTYQFTWTPPATNVGNIVIYVAGNAANGDVTPNGDHIYTQTYTLTPASTVTFTNTYYFPHFALGGGWQTVLTYVNYSQQAVTCETNFLFDDGTPLAVPFGGAAASTRTDMLAPGASMHLLSTAGVSAQGGWAQGQCTGPVKASMLFRWYNQGAAVTEAGVNASTAGATEFVTYANSQTGIAVANPSSTQSASVTIQALNAAGMIVGTSTLPPLLPGGHKSYNLSSLIAQSFVGSVQITSNIPIVSLSLNAEASTQAHLVVSSLPPGEVGGSGPTTYYFPHFGLGGGWQTVLTYVNYSQQPVTCITNFLFDDGTPLAVPFGGAASSTRTDMLAAGGSIHVLSTAAADAKGGWAQGQCTGPVKASMLFRWYNQGAAITEAGVNASTTPEPKFDTYAQSATGIAYANPSTQTASVTVLALDQTGAVLGAPHGVILVPGGHSSENVSNWLGQSFTGSVQIISTVPIVSLSLDAEASTQADVVVSSLPPGDLAGSTLLSTGH